MTHSTAFDRAIARIEADSRASEELHARIEADPRYAALSEYVAIFAPTMPGHGWDGFADIVGDLMSARYWRTRRAGLLSAARKSQISGRNGAVLAFLAKAASARKTEKMYRNAERRAEFGRLVLEAAGYGSVRMGGDEGHRGEAA